MDDLELLIGSRLTTRTEINITRQRIKNEAQILFDTMASSKGSISSGKKKARHR
jgi:hypothetical protein